MLQIYGLTFEELADFCVESRQPAYRAKQLWEWLYSKKVSDWKEMKNIPSAFIKDLSENFQIETSKLKKTAGRPGETRKFLLELHDFETVECVMIPAADPMRYTACVSSQVGCSYRCVFCASGRNGFFRNLSAAEIVEQVAIVSKIAGKRPDNLVYMGIGEPFDNYDSVLKSIRILNDARGLGIGARRITISTCGIVPGIKKFAEEGMQIELSVSLHAPDNDLRSKLMPVNRIFPLGELIGACEEYYKKTGRIVTFEYTMIRGVNDSETHARKLASLIGNFGSRVNLIPLSPVAEFEGLSSTPAKIKAFAAILEKAGINTTLRRSKGAELGAACGQLRAGVFEIGANERKQ